MMLGMQALMDRAIYNLDQAYNKAFHALIMSRTKEEMRKDLDEIAEIIQKTKKIMQYQFEEDKQ